MASLPRGGGVWAGEVGEKMSADEGQWAPANGGRRQSASVTPICCFFLSFSSAKRTFRGRKLIGLPLSRPAWKAASRIRRTKGEGDAIRSIDAAWRIPRWPVISHPAAMPESLWRGMHGRPCCLSGTGASPGRRGEDARTHACREFRARACPGGQRSTDPLQTGRSSARLPASAR